jgi:hypothetical protein
MRVGIMSRGTKSLAKHVVVGVRCVMLGFPFGLYKNGVPPPQKCHSFRVERCSCVHISMSVELRKKMARASGLHKDIPVLRMPL